MTLSRGRRGPGWVLGSGSLPRDVFAARGVRSWGTSAFARCFPRSRSAVWFPCPGFVKLSVFKTTFRCCAKQCCGCNASTSFDNLCCGCDAAKDFGVRLQTAKFWEGPRSCSENAIPAVNHRWLRNHYVYAAKWLGVWGMQFRSVKLQLTQIHAVS